MAFKKEGGRPLDAGGVLAARGLPPGDGGYAIVRGRANQGATGARGWKAENAEEFISAIQQAQNCEGPVLIEVLINAKSRKDLGRPTISPVMNKIDFISNLAAE